MKTVRKIKNILAREHVLSREEWESVRSLFNSLIPGRWFMAVAYNDGNIMFPMLYHHGFSDELYTVIRQVYNEVIDFTAPFVARLGKPVRLNDALEKLFTQQTLNTSFYEKTRIYKKIYAPNDIYYFMRTPLYENKEYIGEIKLHRSKSDGDYTDEEYGIFHDLQPHFAVAVARARRRLLGDSTTDAKRGIFLEMGLSERQADVAIRAAGGLNNDQIAAELGISTQTVKQHLKNIFQKLNISKRGQLLNIIY